jgi:hypothetical protein
MSSEWIKVEVFIAGLKANGFEVFEIDGYLVIEREDFVSQKYPIRSDRLVPPKTFKRYVYGYGVPMTAFIHHLFER